MSTRILTLVILATVSLLMLGTPASAKWDPANGDWSKVEPGDIRVMPWNVLDHLCSTALKINEARTWSSITRIVAGMQPDILLLQETGDNSGNGTGSGVDSVNNLTTTMELFMHGGADPFRGGDVTSYVQLYAPDYDLPHIFVSFDTDGFNRNVIMSKFPFVDLNGDGEATRSDIDLVFADEYATTGNGEIRGFMFAEVSTPCGSLMVGNAHLKAGGSGSDLAQRERVAQRVAYWIDYLLNGNGTGTPDPNDKINDVPAVPNILGERVPVVWGGDWNEDELTNGRKGPAEWMTRAEFTGGSDGTDRDRSDSTYDDARDLFTNSRETRGSSKLDYIAWQDSVTTLRNAWIFDSAEVPPGGMPDEMSSFPGGPAGANAWASDHLPVLADVILALEISVSMIPHAVSVPVGGQLLFDASVTNQTGDGLANQAWIDVFRPDGSPLFASNPKFGPKSFTLNAFQTKGKVNIPINVHVSVPPGTDYLVRAHVGSFPDTTCTTTEFTFEVTP